MIRLSFANLKQRKLRTVLTIVGIMIGIMSIVTMLTAGMGAKKTMVDEVEKSGDTKEIVVQSADISRKDRLLTDSVVTKFEKLENVSGVYPVIEAYGVEKMGAYYGFNSIVGVPTDYLEILNLEDGETPGSNGSRPKLLVGKGVRDVFYNSKTWTQYSDSPSAEASLTGKKIDFQLDPETTSTATSTDAEPFAENTVKLSIVGQTDNEYDYKMYTDIDTLKLYLKREAEDGKICGQPLDKSGNPYSFWCYDYIVVKADSVDDVEHLSKVIKDMGYQVSNNLEMLNTVNRTINIVQLILGAIGSIAGVVAIIGIINTMMTAVYDRVKEIGLLKMIGADSDDISLMFLFESAVMGAVGGILGVGLSLIVDIFLNKKLIELMQMPKGTWIMETPMWLIVLAIVLSIVVSVLAGAFPASWAARIKPLEAIGYNG